MIRIDARGWLILSILPLLIRHGSNGDRSSEYTRRHYIWIDSLCQNQSTERSNTEEKRLTVPHLAQKTANVPAVTWYPDLMEHSPEWLECQTVFKELITAQRFTTNYRDIKLLYHCTKVKCNTQMNLIVQLNFPRLLLSDMCKVVSQFTLDARGARNGYTAMFNRNCLLSQEFSLSAQEAWAGHSPEAFSFVNFRYLERC